MAGILLSSPGDHLHAHFTSSPALIALSRHRLCGIPYTFTAYDKDIYVSDPYTFRVKLEEARAVVTCTQYNHRFLSKQYGLLCDAKVRSIYHGLDVSQFNFRAPTKVESGSPVIRSVAA